MHEMSLTALFLEWGTMSAWMMAPLALILAARTRKSFSFLIISVATFVLVWIALGIPVALALFTLFKINQSFIAIGLLALAAAYQYSKRHDSAVLDCMNTADDNYFFGLRTGWTCFVACGPLMIAVFALMPSSPLIMGFVTVVMVAEFVASNRAVVARSVGLIAAVAAAAILFLSGPIPFEGTLHITHMH
jgi:hypothetical protein